MTTHLLNSSSIAAIAAFLCVWLAPLTHALASPPNPSDHGAGHGAEAHAPEHADGIKWLGDGFLGGPGEDGRTGFLILLINFAVLLLVLNKLLFRNLARANAEKSDSIRLELERATKARAEAEALLQEYETKLIALESEVASIRAAATASAEAERKRILAAAELAAQGIKQSATRAAEREAARVRAEIEREIATQALDRAEAAIRSSFGATDQRRLVDAWIADVSATNMSGMSSMSGGPTQ
jgi:F0F1-type ATP synthase membrane subunit b/b'